MKRWHTGAAVAVAVALLAACGGGSDPSPVRGGVTQVDPFPGFSRAQIDARAQAAGFGALAGAAVCDVTVQRLRYHTVDPRGATATASTAVMVPAGTDPRCTGARPVVLHAHGTTTLKSFNMADVAANAEASLVMAMYAAQGFIVVAPNYLGYDTSSLNYHPYLNAEASAVDMIDGLRAARGYLTASSTTRPSARLFVTGYSQGGHVAMATHKVIERDHANEFAVTASGPMSGPYNLVGFGDEVTGVPPAVSRVNAGATLFVPLLLTSYQRSYGNIYTNPADVYQAPFAATAETLFPTDTPVADLIDQGRLPADASLTRLFGAGGLLTDAFRAGYPTSPYRAALATNTLTGVDPATGQAIGWTPRAPVLMCGGAADPTVFWNINTPVALRTFQARGFNGAVAFDLESRASLPPGAAGDQLFAGFQGAKAQAGASATAQYHGALVPPFCHALVRASFQQILNPPAPTP